MKLCRLSKSERMVMNLSLLCRILIFTYCRTTPVYDKPILKPIENENGVLSTFQNKAWITQEIIIKWLDLMFPVFDASLGRCIVWNSCRAHVSKAIKEHCRKRAILMVAIPGGLTPYLQSGDIGIFKEFKDLVFSRIKAWKHSSGVKYTYNGNPKPPNFLKVNAWIKNSWDALSTKKFLNSINASGFSMNSNEWHNSKHDVYGKLFLEKYILVRSSNSVIESIDISEELDLFELEDE